MVSFSSPLPIHLNTQGKLLADYLDTQHFHISATLNLYLCKLGLLKMSTTNIFTRGNLEFQFS